MRVALTTLLFLSLVACGRGPGSNASGPAVRDSAGVRIVENTGTPTPSWRVAAAPAFVLGWGADDPKFTWIQSGRILPDGGAVVGDFTSGTIYRIAPDGSVTGQWGRRGEGPGEYQRLDAFVLRGDSILVSDGGLRRLTTLSADGDVLATRPLAGGFLHAVSSILDDGRLILVPGEGYAALLDVRPEWVFDPLPILAADVEGTSVDTLANLPHLKRWLGTRGGSPGPVSVKGRAGGFRDGFAWARADRSEVRWFDGAGRLTQVARWDEDPIPLTPEFRDRVTRFFEDALTSSGRDEAFVTAQLAVLEAGFDRYEGPLPYWDDLRVDGGGNVWLREYGPAGQPSDRWRVISRDGTYRGWIEIPDVVAILDITDDRILAYRQDEFDVPALVMLELTKT